MLRLAKRHLSSCKKTSEADLKCRCPFMAVGPDPRPNRRGKKFKKALGTADQRVASALLLDLEKKFLFEPDAVEEMSISKAIDVFLGTKRSTSRDRQRKLRSVLCAMEAFLKTQEGITMVRAVKKPHLDAFISTWAKAISTQVREREMLKEFWLYCFTSEIVDRNPAHKVRPIGTKRDHEAKGKVKTFTPEAIERILQAADDADLIFSRERTLDPHIGAKVRAFVYAMKYSGMALVDVLTLGPQHLGEALAEKSVVPIEKRRVKTNKLAYPSVPVFVGDMLRGFRPESEKYFFWSGNGAYHTRANKWSQRLKKVFVAANVETSAALKNLRSGGKLKDTPEETVVSGATPHMFRHTLVRDLYLNGTPVRVIADILGDDPATVTKYYSCFDSLRHETALEAQSQLLRSDPAFRRHRGSADRAAAVN